MNKSSLTIPTLHEHIVIDNLNNKKISPILQQLIMKLAYSHIHQIFSMKTKSPNKLNSFVMNICKMLREVASYKVSS